MNAEKKSSHECVPGIFGSRRFSGMAVFPVSGFSPPPLYMVADVSCRWVRVPWVPWRFWVSRVLDVWVGLLLPLRVWLTAMGGSGGSVATGMRRSWRLHWRRWDLRPSSSYGTPWIFGLRMASGRTGLWRLVGRVTARWNVRLIVRMRLLSRMAGNTVRCVAVARAVVVIGAQCVTAGEPRSEITL